MKHRSRNWALAGLTAIAVFALILPASAVGDKTVVISDPVNPTSQARIDGDRLRVGDGDGPLTVDGLVGVQGPVGLDPNQNTVQIGNATTDPVMVRNVDDSGRELFQIYVNSLLVRGGERFGRVHVDVPENTRLVITHISVLGTPPRDNGMQLDIVGAQQGESSTFVRVDLVRQEFQDPDGNDTFVANMETQLVHDAGHLSLNIAFELEQPAPGDPAGSIGIGTVSLFGYSMPLA